MKPPGLRTKEPRAKRSRKGDGLDLRPHPFNGVDPAALKAAFTELAQAQAEAFPERIAQLLALLRKCYPPHLLGVLAGWGLTATVSSEGVSETAGMAGLQQHQVEILQALTLTIPWEAWGRDPAGPEDVMAAIEATDDVANAFHQRRLLEDADDASDDARYARGLIEKLRLHTQYVRNWGYHAEVVEISTALYSGMDEALARHHGFTAGQLIAIAKAAHDLVEARLSARMDLLRKILRADTRQRLIRQFFARWPYIEGDSEAMIAAIPKDATVAAVRSHLIDLGNLTTMTTMDVTLEAVAEASGLELDRVRRGLEALSLAPGELANADVEHFFMGNPVWSRPLMRMDERFFCPLPQAFFSHIHPIFRRLIEEAGAIADLPVVRKTFLETRCANVMAAALPGAQQRVNVEWYVEATRYETDVLAKIDRTFVIVEAKGAALSPAGLRGGPGRVKRHVEELIVAPSVQSARLEGLIRRAAAGDEAARTVLAPFDLDFTEVDAVVRISVTLDDFSILASSVPELKGAGWVDADFDLGCTVNIADFTVIADILAASPTRFVHYFHERERVQQSLPVMADELDFLGFYLDNSFHHPALELDRIRLAIPGLSAAIDRFYNNRDAGVAVPKPVPKIRPYFARLIAKMEERRAPGWLAIGCDLLRTFSVENQAGIERRLEILRGNVGRNWRDPEHENALIVTPQENRDTAVLFHAFPSQLAARRDASIEELAAKAIESTGRRRCVVVSRNIDRWDEPYSYVCMAMAMD